MNDNIKHTRFRFAVAVVLIAVILTVAPTVSRAYASTSFGGRATALSISSPLGTTTFADTGPLPSAGGVIDATPIVIQTPVATADGLLSVTMGFDDEAESQAALGAMVLLPGSPNQITAYFAMATSVATCDGVYGFSDITSLTVAGQNILVTGEPNQVVSIFGVLTLIINEQIETSDSITVNALHLETALGTNVIVASAFSSIDCTNGLGLGGTVRPAPDWGVPSFPGCVDFVTGGGWVQPPPNKGTFGFVAGYKNGGTNPRGNLEYHDHTYEINLHALDVLYYNCGIPTNSRVFGGHARVNGVEGYCYQVYVEDNGEPGNQPKGSDYFAMWVWAPPTDCPSDGSIPSGAEYYAVGNRLGGGNIRIHAK